MGYRSGDGNEKAPVAHAAGQARREGARRPGPGRGWNRGQPATRAVAGTGPGRGLDQVGGSNAGEAGVNPAGR
jgi:hypothetical protein